MLHTPLVVNYLFTYHFEKKLILRQKSVSFPQHAVCDDKCVMRSWSDTHTTHAMDAQAAVEEARVLRCLSKLCVHHEYFSLISPQIECFTGAGAITHALYETESAHRKKNELTAGAPCSRGRARAIVALASCVCCRSNIWRKLRLKLCERRWFSAKWCW